MNNTGNNDRLLDKALDLNVAYMFYAYNAAYMKTRFSKPLPRWARIGLGWYFMTAVIAPDGKVSLGRPAPRIQRVMFSRRNHPVELAAAVYWGHKYRFSARLARNGRQSTKGGSPAIAP